MIRLSREQFDAVVFDMDGVLTRTRDLHARSWKQAFDEFLERRAQTTGERCRPFRIQPEYYEHVDGKPRYEGAAAFLAARGIDLEHGDPGDPPGRDTVCGIGNRKNELFLELLERDGVQTYDATWRLARRLREFGFRTAIVSSSRNCTAVLAAAGALELFDAKIDGVDAAERGLAGKPAPDIFLAAAEKLGVAPARAVVVEDATAGVAAGAAGGFGRVIGVDRGAGEKALRDSGAHAVVQDVAAIQVAGGAGRNLVHLDPYELGPLMERLGDRRPALFLDFDGTLTPIVDRPGDARLSRQMRDTLRRIAQQCLVAVVSGRDLSDVRERVGLDDIVYAGTHGFDIALPDGRRESPAAADEALPALEAAAATLERELGAIDGVILERKRFAIAVHYRLADENTHERIEAVVSRVADEHAPLARRDGKMVYELLPGLPWDKGEAVRWLMRVLEIDTERTAPLYVGDDLTDEDAFAAVADCGAGIVVGLEGRSTAARFAVDAPEAVETLLRRLCETNGPAASDWLFGYRDFRPEQEKLREALCTCGNGYFATRGAAPESQAGAVHYPGTYVSGCFNRLRRRVAGHDVENESLVNLPNWLPLDFRIAGGDWLDPGEVELLDYRQFLDLARGMLLRHMTFRDRQGRTSRLEQARFVHMRAMHLAALQSRLVPLDWAGPVEVLSALDGSVINDLVERYRRLEGRHLEPGGTRVVDDDLIALDAVTSDSRIHVALAARTALFAGSERVSAVPRIRQRENYVAQLFELTAERGEPLLVEKTVALHTSHDKAIYRPDVAARRSLHTVPRFEVLAADHARGWHQLWERFAFCIEQENEDEARRITRILRVHLLHLLQTTSPATMDLDVGVPARGLHGEAYRGHIFWDELFVFPLLNLHLPDVTRSLLMYRYRRLDEARRAATEAGYAGAMFPWQSGSSGREESQRVHLNPRSGRWIPDNSWRQRHVNSAIAWNVWQYYEATHDREFLASCGAEMMLEIARFWASIARFDETRDRYVIHGVMGPDEYHDAYPDADEGGLRNNAYTNVMAVWVLARALELEQVLGGQRWRELCEMLDLDESEFSRWRDISRRMFVPFHDDGIISQFEGYEALEELDWGAYRERYGDIQRLDRILEAEDDSPNRYRASKQADVLMLFFLLSAEELEALMGQLDYAFDPATIPKNIEYYMARTSHGSTLSRVVHSWVLARRDRTGSWRLFCDALESDVADIQGGTTAEGIHTGAMAGTVDLLQRCYTGIEVRGDVLRLNPCLPEPLRRLRLDLRYRQQPVRLDITSDRLCVSTEPSAERPLRVGCGEEIVELEPGGSREFAL